MKTKTTMLEYCKQILKSVYFNPKLFLKEYRKALRWLHASEVHELKVWLRTELIQS